MARPCFVWLSLLLLACPVVGQAAEQNKQAVNFVRSLQIKDGGFLVAAGQGASSLRATSAALRALNYFGGEPAHPAAVAQFVKHCFDPAVGGFADHPGGKVDVFTTAVGFMALVELKLPIEMYETPVVNYLGENAKTFDEIRIAAAGLEAVGKLPPQAVKWLEAIGKLRNDDGTTGRGDGAARETGRVIVTVLRLKGKVADTATIVKSLNAGQRADGGYGKAGEKGSDLESCYQVMRAFHMVKNTPDSDKLRAFVATCRNPDGGYGITPGKPSTAPATYYASIILHWLHGK